MKMTYQPKKRKRIRYTASGREWPQRTAATFLREDAIRAERDSLSDRLAGF